MTKTFHVDVCLHGREDPLPGLGRLVVGILPRRPGFDSVPTRAGFVVGKVTLAQVFLRVLELSLIRVIPQMLHVSHACHRCYIILVFYIAARQRT